MLPRAFRHGLQRLLLVVLALATVACARTSAEVRIAGSTSFQPLAELLAEGFQRQGGGRVRIQGGGSTAGLQAVRSGIASLGMISRALAPEESVQGLVAHRIGYDLLTIVVHPSNPVNDLTLPQLHQLFSGLSADWQQVGGRQGPVHLISREAGSGSRDAFRTLVGGIHPRAIVQSSSGAIRVAVMQDPLAIGYVSLGVARLGAVKVLKVGGLLPDEPHYLLRRPLSLVTLSAPSGEALRFIEFARSAAGRRLVVLEGMVPADQ